MFYVYADGESIFSPLDDSLAIFSPKVTLELGKSGSFQFSIPKSNEYYNSIEQLKTSIIVEIDNTEIFRGRVLTITRGFSNIKNVYCEGILSYLVDSVQKANRFNGKAKDLYEKILRRHNAMVDSSKRFSIELGSFGVENAAVVIPGKKEEGDKYFGENKYEQAIIESIVDEWQTTYDYINKIFIDYLGGYLVAKHDSASDKNYIDYISNETFDSLVETAELEDKADFEIEFGVNMLDLSEEINAEDMFTVLVPLGDGDEDELTIKNATNKYSDSSIELVEVNGKQIGIADRVLKEQYGSIVKTHVFDNVNNPNTLFSNGVNYIKRKKHIPITYTVKAVDLHFINGTSSQMQIGDVVKVTSSPHSIIRYLLCTKIEYDLSNPGNTAYTFGNPEQTLTERYKRDKDKNKNDSDHNRDRSAKGGGGAAGAAKDDAIDYAYNGYHEAKEWIEAYGAGTYDALVWYGQYAQGAIKAYEWIDNYGAGAENVIFWYNDNATGVIDTKKWVDAYKAVSQESIKWYNDNATGVIDTKKWVDAYKAVSQESIKWYNNYSTGLVDTKKWVDAYKAVSQEFIKWYNDNATGVIDTKKWVDARQASLKNLVTWYNSKKKGIALLTQTVSDQGASIDTLTSWYSDHAAGVVETSNFVSDHEAGIENLVSWYNNKKTGGFADITQKVNNHGSKISLIASFNTETDSATGEITIKSIKKLKKDFTTAIESEINITADNVTVKAAEDILLKGQDVVIDAVFKAEEQAVFERGVLFKNIISTDNNVSATFNGNVSCEKDFGVSGDTSLNGKVSVKKKGDLTVHGKEVVTTETLESEIKKIVTSTYVRQALRGDDNMGTYLRKQIGCTDARGGAVSLSTYISNHSAKAHTHTFSFGHTHSVSVNGTSYTTGGASKYSGTTGSSS